jgi:hypothetical protein
MGGAAGVNFVRPFVYSLRNRIHCAAKADDASSNAKKQTAVKIRARSRQPNFAQTQWRIS